MDPIWNVEEVASQMNHPVKINSGSPIPFFHLISKLKSTPRTGWVNNNVPNPESIADHMYRMSVLSLFAPPSLRSNLDITKVTKMCLFHDIAESLVGDITPMDAVSKPEKHRREASSIAFLSNQVLAGMESDLEAIWHEFENGETPEARFAQDLDKIELLLQAVEYEREAGGKKDLSSFFKVAEKVQLPEMLEWAQTILKERNEIWVQWGKTPVSESGGIEDIVAKQLDAYYGK